MTLNKEKLLEVVDNIMTEMFFIFPDVDDDGEQITEGEPSEDCLHIGIHFNTEFYLHFEIDKELLSEMASNFMGRSPQELSEEDMEAMAIETANIIGGNYLVQVDPEHNYSLSIPEVLENTKNLKEAGWCIKFVSEDRVLRIAPLER